MVSCLQVGLASAISTLPYVAAFFGGVTVQPRFQGVSVVNWKSPGNEVGYS